MRELFLSGSSVLGMWEEIAAGVSGVFNLNPHPSEKRRVRHPESRGVE